MSIYYDFEFQGNVAAEGLLGILLFQVDVVFEIPVQFDRILQL